MAEFRPKQRTAKEYNNGKKYINEIDSPNADDFNGVIESQLWVQSLAQNTPDSSEANKVGTPSVLIVVNSEGTPLFKFKNLKGEKGEKGDTGQAVVTASKLTDEDLDDIYGEDSVGWYYADGNNTCSNLPPLSSTHFDGFSLSVESMGTYKYQATAIRYIQTFRTFEGETPIIYTRSQKWTYNGIAYTLDGWTEWQDLADPEVDISKHDNNELTNEDLNDIVGTGTFGEWYYAKNGNTCTNLPDDFYVGGGTNDQFNLEVIYTGGSRTQRLTASRVSGYVGSGAETIWIRKYLRPSGTTHLWKSWIRVITTADRYVRTFNKSDFVKISTLSNKSYVSILQAEHKLVNPYIEKIILLNTSDDIEETTFNTNLVAGEKVLSNGTIKVYIDIDLSQFTDYNIKVFLKGE